jgi:hypothetical protein
MLEFFMNLLRVTSFILINQDVIPWGSRVGVNYVLIISTNAGLWGYNIGDTVQFTSLKPYRIIVSGRIKHFISAFGEHVIAKEKAL